nr:tRNA (guanine(26)-N(2))-dimethyltransferase [Ipomoea batatas]GME12692.1 tRNA (guanine(26)-N(2))-dimethyltransferase [Ipomoea batatas]
MASLPLKTLSVYHHPKALNPNLKLPNCKLINVCKSQLQTERGLQFDVGDTFFRHESATGRDLGVLSAALRKKSEGSLRVLDAMCGCGIRSLRYLVEAEADFVLANDANDCIRGIILGNLSRVSGDGSRWEVTHSDATRVLTERYLERDYFDLIDVDSFGSDSGFLRAAIAAVKLGGLLYVTNTDGYSSGGHRPQRCLAAYGAYVKRMPYSNEIGLRMLIGGVMREALILGYHVVPLFSYYSYHGPVFRVLLQVKSGQPPDPRLVMVVIFYHVSVSFTSTCTMASSATVTGVPILEHSPGRNSGKSAVLAVQILMLNTGTERVGPLWTGPLHKESYIIEMLNLAEEWGWIGGCKTGRDLEKLLKRMIDESEPKLPVGYIKMDEIASRAKVNSPPFASVMSTLHKEGYAASRSHIASNAIKTNCPMDECVRIVKEIRQTANES